MKKNLVLLGMMGTGKSTIGKILAKKLGFKHIDTDKLIEKKNKMKINKMFEMKGENFFRNEEEKIVIESLVKNSTSTIISLGGGAFLNETIRSHVISDSISFCSPNRPRRSPCVCRRDGRHPPKVSFYSSFGRLCRARLRVASTANAIP